MKAHILPADPAGQTADALGLLGRNIRRLRLAQGLTLQALAAATRLSPSMLSLLERGRTGPSIGTLVIIASALGAQMSELLEPDDDRDTAPVSRRRDQRQLHAPDGVSRRILRHDRAHGIEIAINEYPPGTANAAAPQAHSGFEFGVTLQGVLEISLAGERHVLAEGELISYASTRPHRIANAGPETARALWINLKRG